MNKVQKAVLIFIAGFLLTGCLKKDTWQGYFYSEPFNYDKFTRSPIFDSLEQCRGWVNLQISQDKDGDFDYECGKNCKYKEGYTIEICEETAE